MSGLRPNSTSWGAKFLFVASVIVGVGLLGVLSHLIVYLTSQTLQNRCFAIAAIGQGTVAIYRVGHRSNVKFIILGINEVALGRNDLGQFAQTCKSQCRGGTALTAQAGLGLVVQTSSRNNTACFRTFSWPRTGCIQWSSMGSGCTGRDHCILCGVRPL